MSLTSIFKPGVSGFAALLFPYAKCSTIRLAGISFIQAVALAVSPSAFGQAQDTLLHSIPGPASGVQSGAQLGFSVAVDGSLTAAGAPQDDIGATNSGVVKVFQNSTGQLLHLIPNPSPADNDLFGISVAMSGSKLVVGASQDGTGATNAGSAYVYDLSSGTPTVPVVILNNPIPATNDNFGRSVSISGSLVLIGAYQDDTGATDAGSAYVYDLNSGTPTVPMLVINNPSPSSQDNFGFSVGISGNRAVVGTYRDDTAATDAGSVYVYDLTGGTPTAPVTTLAHPTPEAGDEFGYSVAISGSRVVVGARRDFSSAANAGSAHVFDLDGITPTVPVATLDNPTPAMTPSFGYSVTISGTRVGVSAPYDASGVALNGLACVYDLSDPAPTVPLASFNSPTSSAGNWFGRSIAISGMQVVVGAPFEDTGAVDSGSAYLYDFTSGIPTTPTIAFNNPGPASGNLFGYSVSISGTKMLVGTPSDDTGAVNTGRAYLYDLAGATPATPVLILNNPEAAANDLFGFSVAISNSKVVIGVPNQDTGASNAGRAYVYDINGSTPDVPVAVINNPSPAANDNFGSAVAVSGTRVLIGAYLDDAGATDAGSAYVYDLESGTPTTPALVISNPDPAAQDYFAFSVGISGNRAVIGAYRDDTTASDAGSVYVYDLGSGTPAVPTLILNNPASAAGDLFGYAIAISDSLIAIGAPSNDTGASNAGCAYVYHLTSNTPAVPTATFNNPAPVASDSFGWAVAISASRLLIGTPGQDNGASNAGNACVYDLNSSSPTQLIATLNNPNPATNDQFGIALALAAKTCVVGMPYDDSTLSDTGTVYVYGPAAQIIVEQTPGAPLPESDSAFDYGTVFTSGNGENLSFTIRNTGTASLNGISISTVGTHAGDFIVNTIDTASSLAPGASTTFSVRFQPTAAGSRNASLTITSSNGDVNPFEIGLSGMGILPAVNLAVAPSNVSEDDETNLVYTFTRNGPAENPLTVSFNVTGTVSFGSDYTQTGADTFNASSGRVTFAAESNTATVTLDPTADTALEADETAILTLTTGIDYTIGTPDSATGTITNDDTEVSIAVSPSSVSEDGEMNLIYTFTRNGPTDNTLTVSFNVSGTASFGSDYTQSGADTFTTSNGTITFAAASNTTTVTFDPTADTALEADETAILTLAGGSGYTIGAPDSATGTITNDDTEVSVAVAPMNVAEDGETNLVYTFTRSGPTDNSLTVSFNVLGTSSFGSDYTQTGADTFTSNSGMVTFAAESNTASITLDPTADTTLEADETAILTIAANSGYTIGSPDSAAGTITNDDTEVSIAVAPSSVTEDGESNLVYTLTRSGPTDNPLTVSFNVSGTASFGSDYTQSGADTFTTSNGTITFATASNTTTVTFDPTADTALEAEETAILTLAGGSGYTIGAPDSATGTITNDDTEVSIAVAPSSVAEDGETNLVYTFTRNGPTGNQLTVSFNVSGTASFGSDYTQSGADTFTVNSGTVTFAAASNTATVTLDPTADTTLEADVTAILTLTTGIDYTIGTPDSATGTITNDDTEVSIAVAPMHVAEDGETNLVYTLTRSGPTDNPLTVSFNVSGTSSFGTDYTQSGADTFTTSNGTITFAAASNTTTVTFDPTADTALEADETAILTLAGGSGYTIGAPDSVTGTITNDDTEVSVAVAPMNVAEDGETNLVYTFTRSGPTDNSLTVSFNVSGTSSFGTDYTQSGADTFTTSNGTVTFAAASNTTTVNLDPTADTTLEADENAILTIAAGSGYTIGSLDSATGTIANDDTEVSIAVAPSSVTEDGETNLVYTFTRSGPTDKPHTVSFNVSGTSSFGSDYTQTGADTFNAASATVTFAAASSTATVNLDPTADTTLEADENAILTIAAGSGYTIGTPDSATGTIANDDTEVSIAVAPSSVTEDGEMNLIYTFTRNGPTDNPLTVSFNVSGNASFDSDYTQTGADTFTTSSGTVTFAAESNTATVTLDPTADTTFEADEAAILTLTAGSGYTIGAPDSATGTITNDDTEVSIAVAPSSVTEDGESNLVYTLTRSGPNDNPLTVAFNVSGTALFGTDYAQSGADTFNAASATVTFAAASSTATVNLDPTADTTLEADENAILTIAAGSGYTIGTPDSATGTIANDDIEVSIAVAPSSVTENGETNLVYTFTRNGPTGNQLTVSFNVSGTASFGSDYTQSGADTFTTSNGTVTFAAASNTATVTLDPSTDTTLEADEIAILTLAAGSGYTIGSFDSATGTITNDDTLDQILVEQPTGNTLTSGSSTVNYGSILVGAPTSKIFTIRNAGTQPISGLAVSILGAASADFLASSPANSLAAGESTSFTVTFTPPDTGNRSVTLRINSNNDGGAPFEITLTGNGATPRDLFDEYSTLAGLSGANAQPGAIPFNDGVTNLIKYAFNLDASGPDVRTLVPETGTAGLPVLVYLNTPPTMRYEFLRRKNSGLTYKPLQSTTLTAGSWEPMTGTTTVTNIDVTWERVIIEQAVTPVKRFFRMQVLMDEPVVDPEVSVTVSPSSVSEDGAPNLVYTFTRNGPTSNPLTVSFNVSGTASFGSDYTQGGADSFSATSGAVTFAAGSSTAMVTLDPNPDTALETDETALLTLVADAGYTIASPDSATGTISNDDVPDQIVVEQPVGNALINGSSTVSHGSILLGTSNSITFVIRNAGTQPISGIAVSIFGEAGADFVTGSPSATLAAGASTSFTVTFTPSVASSRSATLRIISDNIGNTPFDIGLTGTGSTARGLFDEYVILAGLNGAYAQPNAAPFNDGITNLIKYACNLNASGADNRTLVPDTGTAGLPVLLYLNTPTPTIRYEFLRRKNSGLNYTPLQSTTLAADSWEPMTGTTTVSNIDTIWERVVIEQTALPVKRFIRMQVILD